MKTSVLIVAHNEEKYIGDCIDSVLKQTLKLDEVVVICHNCTDATETIARSYTNVTVVKYDGPEGIPYARIKGFETVAGDIVVSLDGDCMVDQKWLEMIIRPLENAEVSLVAGYVILTNSLYSRVSSFFQFVIMRKLLKLRSHSFAWGASFACRKADYEKVGGIAPILLLKEKLRLNFWAEDLYISLALIQIGGMYCALGAKSYTTIPQWKLDFATAPIKRWSQDNRTLIKYFENKI